MNEPAFDLPPCRVDDYLLDPTLLDRLDAVEPWGEEAVTLEIPGGPYAFRGLDAESRQQAIERFSPVVRVVPSLTPGAILTDVRRVAPGAFRPAPDGRNLFEFNLSSRIDQIELVGWRLAARLTFARRYRGILGLDRAQNLIGRGDLENYLRFLAAYSLLSQGGFLLHSSCAVYRDQAYLFIGRSGAGKTTIATMALDAGMSVLSDDMNAIVPGSPPTVHKLPFAGTLGPTMTASGCYPLRAICWLHKGMSIQLETMTAARAVSRLAVCAPYVNADPFRVGRLLESLQDLLLNIPLHSLTIPRDVNVLALFEKIRARSPTGR